ncbi:hypothetical protein FACS1894113_0540 [Alphaproteobacteria bacterium]|nr:hypothetical protein FACS1894113_0540 [Alphaproteobacteria bacterium]
MVCYAIKKFLKFSLYILIFTSLFIYALQVSYVQKLLLNAALGKNYTIYLGKISGLFPFNFSIKMISVSSKGDSISAENLSIILKESLTKINIVSAEKVSAKLNPATKFSVSDIKDILSLLAQKFVKNIDIKQADIDDIKIKDFKFNLDKKTKLRAAKCLVNEKKAEISYNFEDGKMFSDLVFDNIDANIIYEMANNQLNIHTRFNNKKINFDGVLNNDSISGIISGADSKYSLACSLKFDGNSAISEFFSKDFGVSGSVSYNFATKMTVANGIIFENGVVIKPFSMDENLKIKNIDVLLKKGKAQITDINLSQENFSLGKVYFNNIDLAQFFDKRTDVSGIVTGRAVFRNAGEDLKIFVKNSKVFNVKIPDLTINGRYSENKIDIDISYKVLNKINKIFGYICPAKWIVTNNSKMKISSKGRINISDYLSKNIAQGIIKYSLDIAGTPLAPIVSGDLKLKDGLYINKASGTYIKNGTIEAIVRNNKLTITKIHATDDLKSQGKISGSGSIALNKTELLADIMLHFDKMEAVDIVGFDGKLSGDISIKGGTANGLKVLGDLHCDNALYDVSSIITQSNMAFEILEEKIEKKEVEKDVLALPFGVLFDVRFSFKPKLRMIGAGINSRWIGGGFLKGDLKNLEYGAKITLVKGGIQVAGKDFKLKNGTIWLDMNCPGVFFVDVSATKSIESIHVGAKFIQDKSGSDVRFFSNPYMSKNDILSYLLFNHKASEITASEGPVLFSVMSTLSGNKGADIMSKIKTICRVDSFDVKQGKNDGKGEYGALSVGKKLGRNVNLNVEQGNGKDTTRATIEAKMKKNTKVVVDVYGKNAPGVGILWNKRY